MNGRGFRRVWGLGLGVVMAFAASAAQADQFPTNHQLAQSNVSLAVSGFRFGGGLQPDSSGKPSGNGMGVVPVQWWGSGFIVRSDGTLVTNYHVASKAISMQAIFDNGARYSIKHIKVYDPTRDLAVLKINGTNQFRAAPLGDSNRVHPRDMVLAVGNPHGAGLNITEGKVTQVVRDDERHPVLIRHTAAIAGGNSGGALYEGHYVVGVNSATWSGTQFHIAVPINEVKPLLASRYNRLLRLKNVFLPTLDNIRSRLKSVGSVSGTVPAAGSDGKPGQWTGTIQLNRLTDYLFIVRAAQQADLNFVVATPQKPIGLGATNAKGIEVVAISNEYATPASIIVVNPYNSPINMALSVYKITW
ncbi:MAG: trypsin-like peptidase domain-containing protein [Gammaproteobacteria bacterium]